jgi:microcin C transport system permease protein
VLFAGGSYWQIFPLRGLTSDNWDELSWSARSGLFLAHHAAGAGLDDLGFATLTLLTKNSFLDEIKKQYVMTARPRA